MTKNASLIGIRDARSALVALARNNLARALQLHEDGSISDHQVDDAKVAVLEATIALYESQYRLDMS